MCHKQLRSFTVASDEVEGVIFAKIKEKII